MSLQPSNTFKTSSLICLRQKSVLVSLSDHKERKSECKKFTKNLTRTEKIAWNSTVARFESSWKISAILNTCLGDHVSYNCLDRRFSSSSLPFLSAVDLLLIKAIESGIPAIQSISRWGKRDGFILSPRLFAHNPLHHSAHWDPGEEQWENGQHIYLKVHTLDAHLDKFKDNMYACLEQQIKPFNQNILDHERRYQRSYYENMMGI